MDGAWIRPNTRVVERDRLISNLADEPVESRLRIRRRRSVAFAAVLPLPENRIALGDALELHGRQSAISSAFIDLAQRQDVASAVTTAGGVATNAVLQADRKSVV